MAYIVKTRLTEESEWKDVIDMKMSKLKSVPRLFLEKDDAEYFIKNTLKLNENLVMIEEAENAAG